MEVSEKYKKYIARRNRPICEFLTSFCDAKGRENPAGVALARFGSRAWRAARPPTRRPGAPRDRAIDDSIAVRTSIEASRGERRRPPRPPPGGDCLGHAEASKRGAGRKRAAGNVLVSLVMPEIPRRAVMEASSHPMMREGWRVYSSRWRGQVCARVRMNANSRDQQRNTRFFDKIFNPSRVLRRFWRGTDRKIARETGRLSDVIGSIFLVIKKGPDQKCEL